MRYILIIYLLIFGSFFVYAEEDKTEDILYEGPWEIETLGKLVPSYMCDQSFCISPDEEWLIGLESTDNKGVYLVKLLYIPKRKWYEVKFRYVPKNDSEIDEYSSLNWQLNCFTIDSTSVFIDRYRILLNEDMETLTIKEEPELYEQIKTNLTGLGYSLLKDEEVAYEAVREETVKGRPHRDKLRIVSKGIVKEVDYSDIIKDEIEIQNSWWLGFVDWSGSPLFDRKINSVDEVSDDELRKAVRDRDKDTMRQEREFWAKKTRSELEERVLCYREGDNYTREERHFIENIFKENKADDISKLTKEELINLEEKLKQGSLKIYRHGKEVDEMDREELLNNLYFVTESEISISLDNISPSPDGRWLAVVILPNHHYFSPFSSGGFLPCGVLINPNEEEQILKPIRFAKNVNVHRQYIWSNDSKRLYFYADEGVYRLTLKEKR